MTEAIIRFYSADALVEFYNQEHGEGGRFVGPGEGGSSAPGSVLEKPSAGNVPHLKAALGALREASSVVPSGTQEGIVLGETHRLLSLYSLGKGFAKASAISKAVTEKFAAADSWLKSDPNPSDVGLVHRALQAAKGALSYVTGGDLKHYTYLSVAGNVLALAAHFGGVANAESKWPPPEWGEHLKNELLKHVSEVGEGRE